MVEITLVTVEDMDSLKDPEEVKDKSSGNVMCLIDRRETDFNDD